MKQNKFFILAAALAFVACSSDDNYTAKEKAQQAPQEVSFDTYVNRGTTRAGLTDILDDAALKTAKVGFGVFAYYTNDDYYDQSFTPNFMYNQQVANANTRWEYTPVKYWPNEFGEGALSDDEDKVSFFAYAPFVTVDPATGKVKDGSSATYAADKGDATYGIVGMKNNKTTGDPMIKYNASFYTDKQVDLVWGTTGDADITWNKKNTGDQTIAKGLPWLDVEHPTATSTGWTAAQKVAFVFKHALAALNVTVDTYADVVTPEDGNTAASPKETAKTKVYIRSVTFEGLDTIGALNLNNAEEAIALWYNFECACPLKSGNDVTIQDGRKDGKEGISTATKENAFINPDFVQSTVWGTSDKPGVIGTAGNLFRTSTGDTAPDANAPIFVIPNGDPLKVTIEYDVLTADPNLAGKLNDGKTPGSVVKNVITRYITTNEVGSPSTIGMKLENGKKYTIKLHLGLNSVQFDANVTAWDTTGATGGADLPHNNKNN